MPEEARRGEHPLHRVLLQDAVQAVRRRVPRIDPSHRQSRGRHLESDRNDTIGQSLLPPRLICRQLVSAVRNPGRVQSRRAERHHLFGLASGRRQRPVRQGPRRQGDRGGGQGPVRAGLFRQAVPHARSRRELRGRRLGHPEVGRFRRGRRVPRHARYQRGRIWNRAGAAALRERGLYGSRALRPRPGPSGAPQGRRSAKASPRASSGPLLDYIPTSTAS